MPTALGGHVLMTMPTPSRGHATRAPDSELTSQLRRARSRARSPRRAVVVVIVELVITGIPVGITTVGVADVTAAAAGTTQPDGIGAAIGAGAKTGAGTGIDAGTTVL